MKNIKMFSPEVMLQRERGRLVMDAEDGMFLVRVFGIVSFSPAVAVPILLPQMIQAAKQFATGEPFCVRTRRIDKRIPLTSQSVNEEVGASLPGKVDLRDPAVTIGIELFADTAFVFTQRTPGPGGLPVGVSGHVCILGKGPRAVLAGRLMMKRGCSVEVMDEKVKEKLQSYSPQNIVVVGEPSLHALAMVSGKKQLACNVTLPVLYPLVGYPKP